MERLFEAKFLWR
jgi:serine/threonine protein kinase